MYSLLEKSVNNYSSAESTLVSISDSHGFCWEWFLKQQKGASPNPVLTALSSVCCQWYHIFVILWFYQKTVKNFIVKRLQNAHLKLIEEIIRKRLMLTSEVSNSKVLFIQVHDFLLTFLKSCKFERDWNLNSSLKFFTYLEDVLTEVWIVQLTPH